MAQRRAPSARLIIVGAIALVILAVLIFGGFGNALATAGLLTILVAGAAAVRGRASWAGIASRKAAGVVAVAGRASAKSRTPGLTCADGGVDHAAARVGPMRWGWSA